LILRTLAEVLTALETNGIPTILVGSAALALTVYPEAGTRPVAPPEIVIPPHLAEVAVTRLQAIGWQPAPKFTTQNLAWRPGGASPTGQGNRCNCGGIPCLPSPPPRWIRPGGAGRCR
jgi:hypothetical protein